MRIEVIEIAFTSAASADTSRKWRIMDIRIKSVADDNALSTARKLTFALIEFAQIHGWFRVDTAGIQRNKK